MSDYVCSRANAYISGKAQVPVLQLICYTSGTLKNIMLVSQPLYIVTGMGPYFVVVMTFLRSSGSDCGFNPVL